MKARLRLRRVAAEFNNGMKLTAPSSGIMRLERRS